MSSAFQPGSVAFGIVVLRDVGVVMSSPWLPSSSRFKPRTLNRKGPARASDWSIFARNREGAVEKRMVLSVVVPTEIARHSWGELFMFRRARASNGTSSRGCQDWLSASSGPHLPAGRTKDAGSQHRRRDGDRETRVGGSHQDGRSQLPQASGARAQGGLQLGSVSLAVGRKQKAAPHSLLGDLRLRDGHVPVGEYLPPGWPCPPPSGPRAQRGTYVSRGSWKSLWGPWSLPEGTPRKRGKKELEAYALIPRGSARGWGRARGLEEMHHPVRPGVSRPAGRRPGLTETVSFQHRGQFQRALAW